MSEYTHNTKTIAKKKAFHRTSEQLASMAISYLEIVSVTAILLTLYACIVIMVTR
ncbi:MAG: hypothetical protein HUJ58_01000 [Erysipelotrichaceae bacterium]|nr:hypothetical protein [Erysipelotrichaceae bacterium]